jgi:hypothetical protein
VCCMYGSTVMAIVSAGAAAGSIVVAAAVSAW